MSNGSKGGRMSPELTALVHWTVGRCASAAPLEAVKLSSDLITQIQQELTNSYREGVSAVRRVTPHVAVPHGVGGNGSWSVLEPENDRLMYAEGSGV